MLGCIRGKLRNRVWINAGDIVVACPQEDITAKDKCDIVHKFYISFITAFSHVFHIR